MTIDQIKTIAVIGAGTMGQGIAQVCAQAGYSVLLYDVERVSLDQSIEQMEKNLNDAIAKGKLTQKEKASILSRITPTEQFTLLQCDLVIEAVIEKLEVKQKLFSQLEEMNAGHTILATNTSSISITQIAAVLRNPEKCVGLHFFNPAHRMKLVEIIVGEVTHPGLISLLTEFSNRLGKVAVVAKDSPGFIVNRVARHFYVESLKLLEEKVASIESIDQLLKATGFKMGPFELMDLIGIDTNFAVTSSVYNGFHQDPKFRPSVIQKQKLDAGHLGRKTGKGFYDYQKV